MVEIISSALPGAMFLSLIVLLFSGAPVAIMLMGSSLIFGLLAIWTGDMRLVNRYGEIFTAASNARMPIFSGPEGSSGVLLAKFDDFTHKLGPLGKQLVGVSLSAREAWQLKMEDGLTIELGHDQAKAPIDDRLARFVGYYPKARSRLNMNVAVVDLRYPSGFALRPIASAEPTGKQDSKKGK